MVSVMTRAERKARTREELLDAAMELFCRGGFHGTTLDQVAAAAGYTKGAVYSNFRSKEDLFFALYERRVTDVVPKVRTALEAGETPEDLARVVIGRRRAGQDDGWLAVFFEFWAHVLRHPELRERFEQLHRRAREPFVEAARRLGVGDDPQGWTVATYAMVTALSLEQLTDPSLDAAGLAGTMIETMIRGARG